MSETYEGPLRDLWEFEFETKEILAASEERLRSHEDHQSYWQVKLSAWEREMNDTATVDEVPITGGIQRVLRYDPGLQQKVNDARTRRDKHAAASQRFERWMTALRKSTKSELQLRFADITFFFEPIEELPE